jgi:hypothetical protein
MIAIRMFDMIGPEDGMAHFFVERVLTEELVEAKTLLHRALIMLDKYSEKDAACSVCEAIEQLIGAPGTMEQWYVMTGRNPDGSRGIRLA